MKKKYFIIIGITLLIIIGLLTSYIDSARVRNSIEPKFTIKIVSKDGIKVTYWGLGYKVVRYVSVSPNEPYKNNRGAKYGNWFMEYNLDEEMEKDYKFIPTEVENISTYISDISPIGAKVIIKDNNTNPNYYGEWYKIEKKVNNEWQDLETIEEGYGFNEIAYLPDKNNEVKFEMNWESMYGILDYGIYRIIKRVNNEYISIPFSIEQKTVSKIEIIKSQNANTNKFNKYLERDNRKIYLSSEIEEIYYYKNPNTKVTLKDYISNTYQTLDDSINEITNLLTYIDSLNDGGTTIYKSEEFNMSLIICNRINGNYNIYIGDSSLKININEMCE